MIVNWSRISQFQECRRKAYNWDILRLSSWREADPLITGGGFHVGAATLFSTKDVHAAVEAAEKDIRDRLATQMVLPEERPAIEHNIEWTKRAVAKFAEHYEGQDVQVLWPEVAFCVPIPNSWHHCFFVHRKLYDTPPAPPLEESHSESHNSHWSITRFGGVAHVKCGATFNANETRVCACGEELPACFTPHYFKGKTDAVVQWIGKVWLFEHKTNSQAPEIFYQRYLLDAQATGYMWGIWRTVGVRPEGFILNVIQKPYKNAKDQLAVGFGREYYLRSDEDLERFIIELRSQADDYESAFRRAIQGELSAVYMNTKSCTNYSRKCYYFEYCQRNFAALEDEFNVRGKDYVEEEYEKRFDLVTIGGTK